MFSFFVGFSVSNLWPLLNICIALLLLGLIVFPFFTIIVITIGKVLFMVGGIRLVL